MVSKSSKVIPATSKDVRAYFARKPKSIPAGAEKSVQVNQRGRIKPSAVEVFNADKSHGMHYVEGNEPHMELPWVAGNHRKCVALLPKSEVRALAGKSGSRGPLSQADLDFAAEVFASQR